MTLGNNVYQRVSTYTGQEVHRYLSCPHCGGQLHPYPRAAHPHGHRLYIKCPDCTYAAWEHEESIEIELRLALAGVTV